MNRLLMWLVLFSGLSTMINNVSGQIIAVGGNTEDTFLPMFVEAAGGKEAKLALITAARTTYEGQENSIKAYTSHLTKLGVKSIIHKVIMTTDDANDKTFADEVANCTGIMIGAGNQKYLFERVYETLLHKAMLKAYKAGSVIYTNSAGTACLGSWMIIASDEATQEVILQPGFKFIDKMIFDQHYSQRKREWRLKKVVDDKQETGIGIDECTALFIKKDGRETIGQGKIHEISCDIR